jgi:hypothetical protein
MKKRINDVTRYRRQQLRSRLKQEALANAQRDLAMAAEWFSLEEEAWRSVTCNNSVAAGPLRAMYLPADV